MCLQIELIDRVDDIYRNTSWDEEFKGYGVQIQQVCVNVVHHCFFEIFIVICMPYAKFMVLDDFWHCQIIINKSPTKVEPGQSHHNMKGSPVKNKDVWDVKRLLEVREKASP